MRIIGGLLKGLRFHPPNNLPVRPTTDIAKEGLFNILANRYDLEGKTILDLFSGTGNIAMEFASRGAKQVTAVDINYGCYDYLKKISRQHKLENLTCFKANVLKYLKIETATYDIIFADPPYDMPEITEISGMIFSKNLLNPGGLLIVEHRSMKNLSNHPNFKEQRKYGSSSFSFFENETED